MSPSHSATVTALAGALGLHDSLDGSTFATALILACIVMYDVTSEGLHVGRQAEMLPVAVSYDITVRLRMRLKFPRLNIMVVVGGGDHRTHT
nr:acid phosphatase/vanadium-dependent haloperoxidas proteine-related [Tanacetum cinerariifolium]